MQIKFTKTDQVGLDIDPRAFHIMGMTPHYPSGAHKSLKRLIRIRLNLIRELKAFNKELKRHRVVTL